MGALPYPELFFNNDRLVPLVANTPAASPFSEAKERPGSMGKAIWYGNFFPDLAQWDHFYYWAARGAGGSSVMMQYPNRRTSATCLCFHRRPTRRRIATGLAS